MAINPIELQRRSVAQTETPGGLAEIYEETVNIAIWRRPALPLTQAIFRDGFFPSVAMNIQAEHVSVALDEKLPQFQQRRALIDDVAWLSEMFACLFELDQVGLRLTVLNKAMCPRFHVDHVPCRLLTNYVGPATEWLPESAVNRHCLGPSRAEMKPQADSVQRLQNGDVALIKGEGWIGNEGHGLVHRSPSVADGESRLLLSLDFA